MAYMRPGPAFGKSGIFGCELREKEVALLVFSDSLWSSLDRNATCGGSERELE